MNQNEELILMEDVLVAGMQRLWSRLRMRGEG